MAQFALRRNRALLGTRPSHGSSSASCAAIPRPIQSLASPSEPHSATGP